MEEYLLATPETVWKEEWNLRTRTMIPSTMVNRDSIWSVKRQGFIKQRTS
jgi:hypothetical protein